MSEAEHTPVPYRLHDMERATIVAGRPGGEVANCANGFGDQDANADFIILACNSHGDMLAALKAMVMNMANDGGQYRDCFKAAEIAIAKATGAA